MPTTNRNLPAGTVLAARYKGQTYRCTVLEHEGKLAFSLEDNSIHPSVSAAASKVMGGISANGWRFWSLEGDLPLETEKSISPRKGHARNASVPSRAVKVIKRLPNQKGTPEGSTKFWCSACMRAFIAEASVSPERCPEGHAREQADEFGCTQVPAVETD